MTPERLESLKEQAYARIIWGDRKQEVVQFLVEGGMPYQEAELAVKEALRDRAAEVRKQGFQNLFLGSLMIAGSIIGAITYWNLSPVIHTLIMGLILIPAAYGLFSVLRGIPRLLMGKETGAVSDME